MTEIQSLARGLTILNLVLDAPDTYSITAMGALLAVDKSSASRLVKTLINYGYLEVNPRTRHLVPGGRLQHIGWQMMNRLPLRALARPVLEWLVEATGECAHTAVLAEGKALVIDDVETENTLRVAGDTGRMIPLHCTAVGKALLAFTGADLLPVTPLPVCTPSTLTTPETLETHLAQVRAQGYAVDDEEYDAGIRCLAAPVYGPTGRVVASIGISGPAVRVTRAVIPTLAESVLTAAARLSAMLRDDPAVGTVSNGHATAPMRSVQHQPAPRRTLHGENI